MKVDYILEDLELEKEITLHDIATSRRHLQLYEDCKKRFGRQWDETIQLERDWNTQLVKRLVEIKRKIIRVSND